MVVVDYSKRAPSEKLKIISIGNSFDVPMEFTTITLVSSNELVVPIIPTSMIFTKVLSTMPRLVK